MLAKKPTQPKKKKTPAKESPDELRDEASKASKGKGQ